MKTDLLFGCAYYLEYMPYDRIKEDMRMMKAAGMNVIRIAESTWSTLEPSEGVFDFTYIDRMMEAAKEAGLKVIIGTPTYAIPSWLSQKADDIMVETKDGTAKYGHRQLMNICSPTFLFYAERVIRKLMEHVWHNDGVIGYQIDNETKHYGTAGKEVQSYFKQYMMQKFGTCEALNKAYYLNYWSNAIHDWDHFPDMKGCINGGLAGEFAAFQRGLVTEYLNWQAKIVKEYATKDQFVTHNFDFEWKKFGADIAQDGYSYGVQPDVEHAKASECLSIAGCDIYHPTQAELTGAEIAFGGDELRSLKQDHYLVLECQAQAFKYWTPYEGQLRLHAYSHLASGSSSVMYWHWHSIHNGYETYWKGLLSHDFQSNPTYEEACRFGAEWKKLGGDKLKIKKQNKVALLVSNRSLNAFKWFPIDRDLSYNDVVRWMYDSLYEMNVECDIVFEENLDESRYQMIVTPAFYCISEELIARIKKFVSDGGVLVSSFKSFVADDFASVYYDAQPHNMVDMFGMNYNQFVCPERLTVGNEKTEYWAELLKTQGAETIDTYEHRYWGKYAGITKNKYKNGYAYYIGCYTTKEKLKEIYKLAIADMATISSDRAIEKDQTMDLVDAKITWPVIIRSGTNELGEKVHYVLHYSEENEELLCPFENVSDILSGKEYRKGDVITLTDWDVKVLIEQK